MAELFVNALRLHPFVYERSGGWLGHRLLVCRLCCCTR